MLQEEHSAILSTFIKLPFVFNMFVSSFFEWLFYTGFTVCFLYPQLKEGDSIFLILDQGHNHFSPREEGRSSVVDRGAVEVASPVNYVVSLGKTFYPLLSTGSPQENLS